MATTSSINPYTIYPTTGNSGVFGLINGASAASTQSQERFNAVKLLYQTRSQFKADQTAYRQQVRDFSTNARSLNSGSFSLKYMTATADSGQTLQTVQSTLSAYNNLTSSLGKANNLTTQGDNLLSGLEETMASRSEGLETIGITKNEKSGEWTVDEKKFKEAMTKTPQKVQEVLGGNQGLGSELAAAVKPVLSTPTADYLKTPAITNNSQALKAVFSRGIFLDLLA